MNEILQPLLEEVVSIALAAAIAWFGVIGTVAIKKIGDKAGSYLDNDAKERLREALNTALQDSIDTLGNVDYDAIQQYLKDFNPEDLKRFKLEGQRLSNWVKIKVATK